MTYKIASYCCATLLLFALGNWTYGFYTFLRIAVCLTAAAGAFQALSADRSGWGIALSAVAILFNPIIPVYLDRATWAPIDVVCAGILVVSGHALETSSNE